MNDNKNTDALDARLHEAFEQITPDEDALSRMKAAVLAHAGEAEDAAKVEMAEDTANTKASNDAEASADAGDGSARESDAPSLPGNVHPMPRKRNRARNWAISAAAACLVLGAIAVGTTVTTPSPTDTATQETPIAGESINGDATSSELEADTTSREDAALIAIETEENGALDVGIPIDDFNTEEYAAVDESGFVSTKANPLSTVSADVDTASYCNLRRMLRDGYAPEEIPSGAVRIEEMLNYFHYDYATPTGDDLFATTVRVGACPWNDQTKLLVMGFSTAPENTAAEKGRNLVFLIDVSGSMDSPDKLELLQDSFATLLEGLNADDRVSIVTYSGEEEVVLEGAAGNDDKAILRAIYRLRANGSTNGEAGLKMAYDVAERNFIEGGVNRIIMASDGDLNVGMTSESDLHDFVEGERESGIYLSVLGFGSGNYKDTKMETLADHGNGQYHYIDCQEEATRVFGQNLTANLVPLADDVKVQLEFNPAQVKAYRLIGYENREMADEDFKNDAKDAGEVGPGAQFTVAYELVLADSSFEVAEPELKYGTAATGDTGSTDWFTWSLRYQPASGGAVREQSAAVGAEALADDAGNDWRFAASVVEFGMLLRDSDYKGSATWDSARQLALDSRPDEERQGLVKLLEAAQEGASRAGVEPADDTSTDPDDA